MKKTAVFILGLLVAQPAFAQSRSQAESSQAPAQAPPKPTERPERHVVLMPTVGVWSHPFKDSSYHAKAGPVWGADVVLDPFRFMNVRGGIMRGNQPMTLPSHALSDAASVSQPALKVLRMHVRLEPIWHYTETLAFYAGLGMGWAHVIEPAFVASPKLATYDRTSVYLGYEGAAGVQFEPIANWLMIDFSVAASYLANQSGAAYDKTQAFTEDGHRTTLGGLSKFSMGYRMCLGIGLVL
jgi:opacity protein-like surface antigen